MSDKEKNGNGYIRWPLFWGIMLVIIGVLYFIGENVIANEKENRVEHETIKSCINTYIIPMKEDIAAIRTKMGLPENGRRTIYQEVR